MRKTLRFAALFALYAALGAVSAWAQAFSFTCPATVASGATFLCSVTGTPANAWVNITSNTNAALTSIPDDCWTPPATGRPACQFTARKVTKAASETVTAKLNGVSINRIITVTPGGGPPPPPPTITLRSLSCSQASVTGPASDFCTVTTSGTSTAAQTVALASGSPSVAVPASVTVPAGSVSAVFSASAMSVTAATTATLTGTLGTSNASFLLTDLPLVPPPPPTLTSLVPTQTVLIGAVADSLTAHLSGAATVATSIAVTSSSPSLTVPGSVPVPVGASSVIFQANASAVTVNTPVTVTASLAGNTTSTSITLEPVPPPPTAYEVNLTWQAPASPADPAAKYDVYRNGAHLAFATATSFVDLLPTSLDGMTLAYTVKSVDSAGVESASSNMYPAAIP